MIARKISDVRKFMSGFLIGNMLDNFRLAEAVITTFCTFTIDGRLERRFFGEAEETDDQPENAKNRGPADLVAWKDVRERCFDLIRGKRTPLFFRFVFFSSAESASALLRQNGLALPEDQVPGLCLNLRYSGMELYLTTGTSYRTFTMDKTADRIWDEYVDAFLKKAGIETAPITS